MYEELELKQQVEKSDKVVSIDLGVNNVITFIDSVEKQPYIANGRIIKSINQFCNKKIAKLKSIAEKLNSKKSTKQIRKIWDKRSNILKDHFHKLSRKFIDHCIKNQISRIVIGYTPYWKQEINLGKRNNQNFVQIPFGQLIQYIKYKAEEVGIEVILHEESYTSKCSSLSLEKIEKKDSYGGKRLKRGLYHDFASNKTINADVNGALNIMRKATDDSIVKEIISSGRVFRPLQFVA